MCEKKKSVTHKLQQKKEKENPFKSFLIKSQKILQILVTEKHKKYIFIKKIKYDWESVKSSYNVFVIGSFI